MPFALVFESDSRDADRLRRMLGGQAMSAVVCSSISDAERELAAPSQEYDLAFLSWELTPPSPAGLLKHCKLALPSTPVIVVSGVLDARLAARAAALGAADFLEKPLDGARVRSCVTRLLSRTDPLAPALDQLRTMPLGEHGECLQGCAPVFLSTLRQIAKIAGDADTAVLLTGESGTGKELLARAIHRLGPRRAAPLVAVNVGAIPPTLIESHLFGHEKGAFTDAREMRRGYLEEAAAGTLFLDEIGDLELALQVKLLRVIQEKEFRRLGGSAAMAFSARLVCATNRNLAEDVGAGRFRRDLFHRIAEFPIHVPSLRERTGDVELLLRHFLDRYRQDRNLRFSREALTILRGYPFTGNVRELENTVKSAIINCVDSDEILPHHLPLQTMGTFVDLAAFQDLATDHSPVDALSSELRAAVPADFLDQPYRGAAQAVSRAFDRVYLASRYERCHHSVTRAAAACGMDRKTFRKHWEECGLPPLSPEQESGDE